MNRRRRSGWQERRETFVRKLLGPYPIKDAKVAFRNVVLPQDIRSAKVGNPNHCALARSLARQTGMKKGIAVFHSIAYAPFDKHGDGKIVIERFAIENKTKKAIEQFDRTGKFAPGEYIFLPLPKSLRKGAKKNKGVKTRTEKVKWNRRPRTSMLGVRNGTGRNYNGAMLNANP